MNPSPPDAHTHAHSQTYIHIHPAVPQSVCTTTGAKRQKDKMSLNPDLAPRGASRFITVVRATLQGVFQVSLVMEKVTTLTSLYHWIWIVPCGYAPPACGALLSPIMLEWQKQLAGRSLAGKVIDNFSYLGNICSFSSNNFDRLHEDQRRRESKA